MAVVINEFEVAPAEPPETKRSAETGQENVGGGGGEKPQAQDIEKMLAHHAARCERVWAH